MTRLSMLIGIGLMLVGASAYALPEHQYLTRLVPAIGGIIIAMCGFVAMSHDNIRKHVMHLSTIAALAVLVYAAFCVVPDCTSSGSDRVQVISDVDTLGLTAVYMYCAIKNFVLARILKKKEGFAQD